MSGGNRNFARGFEERRGNGNFHIKGRNIREELRGDRSRGIRRQMEEKCGIMNAQIPQIDLEEIPYIVTLVVNGQQCDCLVDTGAVVTLVRKRIITVGDIDTERRTEVRLVSVTGHRLEIFGTTCLRFRIDNCRKVEFEAYVCESETTGPTQVILGRDFLVKNRVQLKYGPEPVMVLWGQTVYFHSRRGIEKDVEGVETTSRKYYWSSIREVLPRRVLQEEKVQRKSPEREEKKRETEKGWAKWLDQVQRFYQAPGVEMVKNSWKGKNIPGKSCLKERTENGGTPLEKEEIGIQIEMVMKKEEKCTEELEEGGSQMIDNWKWQDATGHKRKTLKKEMEIQVIEDEEGKDFLEKEVQNTQIGFEDCKNEVEKVKLDQIAIKKDEIKKEIDKFEGIDSDAKFQELSEYSLRLVLEMDDLNLLRGGDLYNKKIKMLKEVLQYSNLLEKKVMKRSISPCQQLVSRQALKAQSESGYRK
ncbi:hypothetical protein JTB14_018078 [Gonioctena quinquepunctata]|nr:hypothetical protein JTB14_018078 [Gonioctena quinquepunctata]